MASIRYIQPEIILPVGASGHILGAALRALGAHEFSSGHRSAHLSSVIG